MTRKPSKKKGKQGIKKAVNHKIEVVNNVVEHYCAGNPKIDIQQAIKMRIEKHMSYQDIANHFGTTKPAVFKRLKWFNKFLEDPEGVNVFEDAKPHILSAIEQTLLKELVNPSKLQKANLNNVAYSYTQVHQANRLERNLSTNNSLNLNIDADDLRYRQFMGLSNDNSKIDK